MLLALALLGAAPAPPVQAAPMGEDEARTLLTRTGFGATRTEVAALAALSRHAAVDRLLASARSEAVTPPPEWTARFESPRGLDREQRREWRRREAQRTQQLRAWWLAEMRATPSPLTERMTLFWHSHFATSQRKVRSATLMYRQNALLRRHALGRFDRLLHAIVRDPAMLLWLDGHANRAGRPNENLARELMELFTLGEGHYSQRDVTEAARALTGLAIDPRSGETVLRARWHDGGEKTVLGRSGRLDAADLVDRLLAHPRTAEHLADKLWRAFVSPQPDPARVQAIAARLRDSDYDLKAALRELLLDDALYAPGNRGTLVKPPLVLVLGTLHTLQIETPDPAPFAAITARLGQALFAPPGVKGWPGGEAWIDASSLLARRQFLERVVALAARDGAGARDRMIAGAMPRRSPPRAAVLQPDGAGADADEGEEERERRRTAMRARFVQGIAQARFAPDAWVLDADADPQALRRLLLAVEPVEPPPAAARGLALVRALLADPAYQVH